MAMATALAMKAKKIYCKLLDKEVNLRYTSVQVGRGDTLNQHQVCYENHKGKVRCIFTNDKECLEKIE